MALFKIFKGRESNKITNPNASGYRQLTDGYAYYDTSTRLFYIDAEYPIENENGELTNEVELSRKPINAYRAQGADAARLAMYAERDDQGNEFVSYYGHSLGLVNNNTIYLKDANGKSLNSITITTNKVKQINDTSNTNYRLLLSNSANNIEEDNITHKNDNLIYNPSTMTLRTGSLNLTGELDVVGNAYLHNETQADSLTADSLLVTGNANFTQIPTAPTATAGTSNTQLATTEFVTGAVQTVVGPMRFMGSLGGSGATITSLPTASSSNKGYTYKVIKNGTYGTITAKAGDTVISTGSDWVLIPSGDEPSGTVTSITLKAGDGITLDTDNTAITTSGTRTISHKNTSSVTNLAANGRTYVTGLTFDTYGHVTGYTTGTETVTNTKVTQSTTTSGNWRKILLNGGSGTIYDSWNTAVGNDVTDVIYRSQGVSVQPSTNTIKANNLYAARAFNNLITGTGTAAKDNGSGNNRYMPAKWTFNTGANVTNGDTFLIKIPVAGHDYGVFMSVDNGTNYYPVVTNGTSRVTTHYPVNTYLQVVFENTGSAASIFPLAGGTARVTVSNGVFRVINYYDSNSDNGYYHRKIYPNIKAGANKIFPYTLIMQNKDGRWESIVTSASTGTSKAKNTHGFLLEQVWCMCANATYNENGNVGMYNIWSAHSGLIDMRYSINVTTSSGMTGYKPVYLVGTIGTDGLFYLADAWWSQTLPTTDDGKVYVYIGDAYDAYRLTLSEVNTAYFFRNDRLQMYGSGRGIKDISRSGTTFTVTRDDGSTFTFTQQDNNALNWGQITQSGANNISEGNSDFTDNTEIFSSYASDNGFADTNAPGKVYRRDAVHMYNYIKTKLAVTNNNINLSRNTETTIATIGGTAIKIKLPASDNTDTKVTSAANHYTPVTDANSELTASLSGTAGSYALNTEYTVLTGVKVQRDAKGHVTGLTYTAQKIKDTNTTYTLAGLMGSTAIGSSTKPVYWTGSAFAGISSYEGNAATATKLSNTPNNTTTFLRGDNTWSNQLNGPLTLYREGTTASNAPAGITFTVKDTDKNLTSTAYLNVYNDHSTSYNTNLVLNSAGNTFIGAGESASSIYSAKGANLTGESLYLSADAMIYMYTNSDTAANRIGFVMDTGGNIVPQKAEAANDNIQNLGSSNNRWKNIYAATFVGALSGNATTATKFASAQSITLTGDITGTASSQAGWSVATTLANSGVTANTYGNTSQQTPAHGGTFNIPYFKVDAKGRVTQAGTTTVKLPADSNTDTKVNVIKRGTSKSYILGDTTVPPDSATAHTAVAESHIYMTTTAGQISAKSYSFNDGAATPTEKAQVIYNTANGCLEIVVV